jgi:hypothetical protein
LSLGREAVGVALSAVTASTVFTLILVGEKADRAVEVLETSFPTELKYDQRNTFALSIIARRPVQQLEIQLAWFFRYGPAKIGVEVEKKGRDGMLSVPTVLRLYAMAEEAGLGPVEYEIGEVERNGTQYSVYIMDFTDLLILIANNPAELGGYSGSRTYNTPSGVTSVFAGLFDHDGLAYLYGGVRDFYYGRNITIAEMVLTYNGQEEVYRRIGDLSPSQIASGIPTLLDAPGMGTLRYSHVERDDSVRLAFFVDKALVGWSDPQTGIDFGDKMWMVRIMADGEAQEDLAGFYFYSLP